MAIITAPSLHVQVWFCRLGSQKAYTSQSWVKAKINNIILYTVSP